MRDERKFFEFVTQVHRFFEARGFLHTYTPPMVENPGMEVHIHPFQVQRAHGQKKTDWYLHTSPEFAMKSLLSQGLKKIYQINWCFRDEPASELHRPQFLMLEWYRADVHYQEIMNDISELIFELSDKKLKVTKKTINQLFKETLGFEILDYLNKNDLHQLIKNKFPHLPLHQEMPDWDDYFFLIFLNEIEPKLKDFPAIILYEYPFHQAALSTIKQDDPRVCERFELYLSGIEIANCFNESTELEVLRQRFKAQSISKKSHYDYELPEPNTFYHTMKDYPASAGIALGVERLYGAISNADFFKEAH